MKQLILGGARSGKSKTAEERAKATGKNLIYIATGQAGDSEMSARIREHKRRRGKEWTLVEEPLNLAQTLTEYCGDHSAVVVDCLTLWVANCLNQGCMEEQKENLLKALPLLGGDILFVSNEVGSGIVPLGELSREFVDQSGWLHQRLGEACEKVSLIIAGLPLELKQ